MTGTKKAKRKKVKTDIVLMAILALVMAIGIFVFLKNDTSSNYANCIEKAVSTDNMAQEAKAADTVEIPEYEGKPYIELEGNKPKFEQELFTEESLRFFCRF